MNILAVVIVILVLLVVVAAVRVVYELKTLISTEYSIESEKIKKETRLVLLADLHNCSYGDKNQTLIQAVRKAQPDFIIFSGDMITASQKKSEEDIIGISKALAEIAPVFYVPGNHEKKLEADKTKFGNRFEKLISGLETSGIHYLSGDNVMLNDSVTVHGLDLPLEKYKKTGKINSEEVIENIGEIDKNKYNILVAHSPRFFSAYAETGVDVVLSGHYHGGAVRIPGGPGIISPQCVLFPKYSVGKFTEGKTTMVVTAGCGTHSVNLRLFNKPEIVVIDLK